MRPFSLFRRVLHCSGALSMLKLNSCFAKSKRETYRRVEARFLGIKGLCLIDPGGSPITFT
jgi:hypothetical protein